MNQKGIGIFAYGSLGGGILSGKYKTPPNFSKSDARSFFYKHYDKNGFSNAEKIINILNGISADTKMTPSQVALHWIWQKNGIITAITGARTKEQVRINAASSQYSLPDEHLKRLDEN